MKKIIFTFSILLSFNSFSQWTDSGTNLTTSDNVGIGTTTPLAKLHVFSNEDAITWPAIINNHRNSPTVSNYGVGLMLKHSSNSENYKWGGIASVQEGEWANASGLALYANETEYMRIKWNGNVGIGIASPERRLEIGDETTNLSAFAKLDGFWSTDFARHARLEFNDKNFGIGAGRITSNSYDDDLYLWSYNGEGRDISFLSTSDGETDPYTWSNNLTIKGNTGNVGIGVTNPDSKLVVDGKIRSEEVKVEIVNGPDYVFEENYELRTLEETKAYITENKHLPEIPSAKEMEANGIDLGDMNMKLLKKVEELTLYLIQMDEAVKVLQQKNALLEASLSK